MLFLSNRHTFVALGVRVEVRLRNKQNPQMLLISSFIGNSGKT